MFYHPTHFVLKLHFCFSIWFLSMYISYQNWKYILCEHHNLKKNWLYNTYESRTMGNDILFFTHFLETFRLRFYVIHSICNYIFFVSIVLSNGSIHKYTEWQSASNALYIAVTSLSSFVEWSQNGPSREWWGSI